MENFVGMLLALLIGLALGAGLTHLLLRGWQAAAREQGIAEGAVERASLSERLRAAEDDVLHWRSQSETQHTELQSGRAALQQTRLELATLGERANQIPGLESSLAQLRTESTLAQQQLAELREAQGQLGAALKAEREQVQALRQELATERDTHARTRQQLSQEQQKATELNTRLQAEQQQSGDKLKLLTEARETLSHQFKTLAAETLEKTARTFSEQNQTSLGHILEPLKTRLHEFQGKVEQVYVQESKDRSSLAEQVRHLMTLNQTLSSDAKNLTRALKGSNKAQGNWGELILERVLESSGLRRGQEYDVQESHARDDGIRQQPDVVIHLPQNRHLVVDAKVSLNAYEAYTIDEDDAGRQAALKRHLDSVRSHIAGLSGKNYQQLHGLQSLDFVLMFVPIEPAFMLAVTQDDALFMDAFQKNVLLVSPSTLLFVVRTVAHLWRQEAQSRNAQDIAKRGAELYDKLCGFVEDLEGVGKALNAAQQKFGAAHSKFAEGRGNVIRQAQMLRDLGVKPSKQLPQKLLDAAGVDGDDEATGDATENTTGNEPASGLGGAPLT